MQNEKYLKIAIDRKMDKLRVWVTLIPQAENLTKKTIG
ncbi:hypothetical protein DSBG_2609 [Desulfosporosinus sp. BG]|nr:hypothetical protein DSBG_2609 [Desulfosporosinus sp. BG]